MKVRRFPTKGWLGGNDHHTSPQCWYFDDELNRGRCCGNAREEFRRLLIAVEDLTAQRLIDPIYVDYSRPYKQIVAFRFVSDQASREHYRALQQLAPSLGRGSFKPFHDQYQFDTWFKEQKGAA